jgi:thiol:disulfide interchange protein DsbD
MTVLLTILLAGSPAAAQDPADVEHTHILSVQAEPATPKVGETFQLVFKVQVDPAWHIYSANGTYTPTEWEFDKGVPVERAGKAEEPKPKHHREVIGDSVVEYDYHEGEIAFRVPVRLTGGAKPGPLRITGQMTGQECDPNGCIPFKYPFAIEITVAEGTVAPPPAEQQKRDAANEAAREFEEKGLGWLLGLGFLGGLISLVMPCVYPMIPITITFFVKQAGTSRPQAMLLSLAYAVGIIVTFTGIGFLLTVLLGAQGAQIFASNPWVNLIIAAVFGIFALSLLGLFEIRLPSSWTNSLVSGGPKGGVAGAFTLGLLFSVITFTCTIPFAATILAVAASGGHRMAGLLAMFVYSATMAIPFLFLGFFPSAIKELPKSGGWLHTMQVAAGLFEIALAAAYIWQADAIWRWSIFDRPVVLSIWIAVSFAIALYLLGVFRVRGDSESPGVGIGRVLSGLTFAVIGFYLIGGLAGRPLGIFGIVLPPDRAVAADSEKGDRQKVYERLAEAEERARAEGKPVFVEFTGVT